MFRSLLPTLRRAVQWLRSHCNKIELARSRSPDHPVVRVMLHRGQKRLDAPTVNYSFGTLHTILDAALAAVAIRTRAPRHVLVLGLGAGSIVHLLRRRHGIDAPIVAVEIDAEVVRLAREHFGLDAWHNLEVVTADAVQFVQNDARCHDLVVVDVFTDAVVPAALRTGAFLRALHSRMTPGGLLLFNVVADAAAVDIDIDAFETHVRAAFPTVEALTVRTNVVFVAAREANG